MINQSRHSRRALPTQRSAGGLRLRWTEEASAQLESLALGSRPTPTRLGSANRCATHEAYHKLFNTAVSYTYPDGPAIGTVGERVRADAIFDGWGYVHLFSNTLVGGKFAELDTFAIPEGEDPAFATGYGDLTVHEVATDPQSGTRAYLSYYNGGFRALEIQCSNPADQTTCELVETGGYLDRNGNDFWGVEAFVRNGTTYILASDRDDGLWIFKRNGS